MPLVWWSCAVAAIAAQLFLGVARAADQPSAAIAVIIDDMGDRLALGERALNLPGAVTVAILPHTPYSRELADQAHARGKEVMLHLPMESTRDNRLGPGGLTLDMTRTEFDRTVEQDIASVPYVAGINNHMGSLLTQHPGDMSWLMDIVAEHPQMFFLDSRTTNKTVAQQVAIEHMIPNSRRDVFLDDDPDRTAIELQFDRLVHLARETGTAIGIGHPNPETLAVLRERLSALHARDRVTLLSVSRIIQLQQTERHAWRHASLSLLRPAAKSSKP